MLIKLVGKSENNMETDVIIYIMLLLFRISTPLQLNHCVLVTIGNTCIERKSKARNIN